MSQILKRLIIETSAIHNLRYFSFRKRFSQIVHYQIFVRCIENRM